MKRTILAVDDTSVNLDIIVETLRNDYNVKVATNGPLALKMLEKQKVDCILLDILMPEMDGFEVCQKIKDNPQLSEIPVIFLTVLSEAKDIIRGFEAGAVDYVSKPFYPAELHARVSTHVSLKVSKDKIKEQMAQQRELLHVLCHDLANPFTSMLGVLKLVENLPEDYVEYFDLLRKSARNGIELIDLVRKMRALEEKPLVTSHHNLLDSINQSIEMIKHRATEKSIEIIIDVGESIEVTAERTTLVNSIFSNLLTNAIKFSFPGSKIHITAEEREHDCKVTVQDFGIGMSASLIADVFDINKVTSRRGTVGERGTGFGMPLVRKFMTAYGGDIKIRSMQQNETSEQHGTEIILLFQK